jgi:hypothetical protein
MFQDRRQRHVERCGKLADGERLLQLQLRQECPPRGVGKGGEGAVEGGVLILNHVVKLFERKGTVNR